MFIISFLVLANTPVALAYKVNPGEFCKVGQDTCDDKAGKSYYCEVTPGKPDPNGFLPGQCVESKVGTIFGKITPPDSIKKLIGSDQTGAGGISQFLSNLVALFFSIAAIVLIFMLLWGAFEWIISEGDKEKLQSAQRKIISAIIGIILFAVIFAVLAVLGQFTGFKFFKT